MEIVEAIEAKNMRAVVSRAEGQRRRIFQRRRFFQYATAFAAACIVLGVYSYNSASDELLRKGDACLARYEIPIIKGNSNVFNLISSAADCIEGGLYEVAEERLDKALEIISTSKPSNDQEASIAGSIRDDVEWLRAISLMKQGKVLKSRKAFKAIASSNSFYKDEAKRLL